MTSLLPEIPIARQRPSTSSRTPRIHLSHSDCPDHCPGCPSQEARLTATSAPLSTRAFHNSHHPHCILATAGSAAALRPSSGALAHCVITAQTAALGLDTSQNTTGPVLWECQSRCNPASLPVIDSASALRACKGVVGALFSLSSWGVPVHCCCRHEHSLRQRALCLPNPSPPIAVLSRSKRPSANDAYRFVGRTLLTR